MDMFNLIKNELIKIFKRKNIYIIVLIGISVILINNIFDKLINNERDILEQYKKVYNNDMLLLNNYDQLNPSDTYEEITERIELVNYAIENNIKYNILFDSENSNVILKKDARYQLIQVFEKFEVIIIVIILYLSSTIISEEMVNGTIKKALVKPHIRQYILFSKAIAIILIILFFIVFFIFLQYLIGGILFGFDSYNLEAIRYNSYTQEIETMRLSKYMFLIIICKIPKYLILMFMSLLFGIVTNNIALNILLSLGVYFLSTIKKIITVGGEFYLFSYFDISNYLFANTRELIRKYYNLNYKFTCV